MEKTGHYSRKITQREFEYLPEFNSCYKYKPLKDFIKQLLKKYPDSYLEELGMPGSMSVYWVNNNIKIDICNWK